MARKTSTNLNTQLLRLTAVFGLVFALFAALAAGSAEAKKRGGACTPSVTAGLGSFGPTQPDACWRPYSSDSVFNTKLPRRAQPVGDSSQIVSRLNEAGPLNYMVTGDPERDYGIPSYFADAGDPLYTVHCVADWGECDVEGMQIPVPAGARPSGVWPLENPDDFWDSHLTIVDQESGWEYDFWDVRKLGNGELVASWGGRTQITGDGLGSDAVASQFGSLAGTIRPEELAAGKIRHALVLNVPCTNGYVWPATKGAMECSEAGMPSAGAPAVGQLFQLKISSRKIRQFPRWKQAVLKAFRDYGAYVSDTTAVEDQWNLRYASPVSHTAVGQEDTFTELARSADVAVEDYNGNGHDEFWFDVGSEVDWTKLRAVTPPA